MSAPLVEGRCLCSAVSYRIRPRFHQFHICHCSRCQQVTGSAHAANIFADPDSIEWLSGSDRIKRYDLPQARFFSHAFCTECGSAVPYLARSGRFLIVPAGGLEGPLPLAPQDQIFWDDRAPWYDEALHAERFATFPTKP